MSKRKRADKSEKKIIKKYGGKQQINSGAVWYSKGDVKTDKFLIEDKTFMKPRNTFILNIEDFKKHCNNASFERRIPLYRIAFNNFEAILVFRYIDIINPISVKETFKQIKKTITLNREKLFKYFYNNIKIITYLSSLGKLAILNEDDFFIFF